MKKPQPKVERAADRPVLGTSAWADLGLTEPLEPLDDSLAPPVNRKLLQKLVQRQLPATLVRAVLTLTYHFPSWKQAYLEVLVEEQPRGK